MEDVSGIFLATMSRLTIALLFVVLAQVRDGASS